MSNNRKIFDDFPTVDCNECESCERWWLNQCDGVSVGSTKPCNSFLATRSILIPKQLKSLQRRIDWLSVIVAVLCLIKIISVIWRVI